MFLNMEYNHIQYLRIIYAVQPQRKLYRSTLDLVRSRPYSLHYINRQIQTFDSAAGVQAQISVCAVSG